MSRHDDRNTAGGPRRRLLYGGVLVLLFVTLAEVLSLAVFRLEIDASNYVRKDLDGFPRTVSVERLVAFGRDGYDAATGWLPRPNTRRTSELADGTPIPVDFDEYGARHDPHRGDRILASCYGDSFTYGSEVNDDETWPHYLGVLSGSRVLNLGVPGYGTDQALWRLRSRLPEGRTPVVVLTNFAGNIRRLITMHRAFYTGARGNVKFKPMLLAEGDGFRPSDNPLARAETMDDYLRAFETAKTHGYWYRWNQRKPEVGFPYSLSLLRVAAYALLEHRELNLYEVDDAALRLRHVVREFASLAEEHRFLGIVLFIPDPHDLQARRDGRPHHYRGFLERMRTDENLAAIPFLDVLDLEFDEERFNVKPFAGHTSPYANRIIAEALHELIAARELSD